VVIGQMLLLAYGYGVVVVVGGGGHGLGVVGDGEGIVGWLMAMARICENGTMASTWQLFGGNHDVREQPGAQFKSTYKGFDTYDPYFKFEKENSI